MRDPLKFAPYRNTRVVYGVLCGLLLLLKISHSLAQELPPSVPEVVVEYEVRAEFESWFKMVFTTIFEKVPQKLIYRDLRVLEEDGSEYSRILLVDKDGNPWMRVTIPPHEKMTFAVTGKKPVVLDEDGERFFLGLWRFLEYPDTGGYRGVFVVNRHAYFGFARVVPSDIMGVQKVVFVVMKKGRPVIDVQIYILPGEIFVAPLVRVNLIESGIRFTLRAPNLIPPQ